MEETMIETTIGLMPLKDYLEIRAMAYGFDSYEELCSTGYHIAVPGL